MKKNQLLITLIKSFLILLLLTQSGRILAQQNFSIVFYDRCKGLQLADSEFNNTNPIGFLNWGYYVHQFDVDPINRHIMVTVSTGRDPEELILIDPINESIETLLKYPMINSNDAYSYDFIDKHLYIYRKNEKLLVKYDLEKKSWDTLSSISNMSLKGLDPYRKILFYNDGKQNYLFNILSGQTDTMSNNSSFSIDIERGHIWLFDSYSKIIVYDYVQKIQMNEITTDWSHFSPLGLLVDTHRKLYFQRSWWDSIQIKRYYELAFVDEQEQKLTKITGLACGIEKIKSLNIQIPSSVKINKSNSDIKPFVFPNPADNIVSIKVQDDFNGNCSLAITDLFGRIVMSKSDKISNGLLQLDLSHLIPGSYGIKIATGQKVHSSMVIKN
ncbi:MAG: T9SS type A sorting domain-containing protein [Saprospiraceae bacterium]|nr:T9SS type A sorting domain-containing protein [Saprospiraceae bacterium]MBK7809962.1 T9SS type A sorting domain-containing protein [Saprospiraceae bacterium]MBK9629566.1 T9SS type A sorting domain-containing protein [Saprospiraceae bacterium]